MPVPIVPILPLLLRMGAAAAAGFALSRGLRLRPAPGRRDQRAEDALDALPEGLTLHHGADLAEDGVADDRQHNATLRLRRRIAIGQRSWDLDAGVVARLRLRGRDAGDPS